MSVSRHSGRCAAPSTSTALSSVLAADALIPLLDEPLIRDQIVALGEHLPEGRQGFVGYSLQ